MGKAHQEEAKKLRVRCLDIDISALLSNIPAIDVFELIVRELEIDPLFNSGRGSDLTEKRTVEMEANIIDGPKRRCDVVFGLSTVKNPVSLAHLVMDKSPHFYLAFSSAEEFDKKQGVELVDNEYFIITKKNVGMLKLAKEVNSILFDYPPTLQRQSVAVDKEGSYAAATSTSGLMNKMTGRIGDSPLIGPVSTLASCVGCHAPRKEKRSSEAPW
ncbi:Isoaspartyl peptidase/L-asparaginase [Hibiscus syriacus]|uniref:Isoaspartyl peptidase/L-asparaginase n=1 Tax=Hibiscus syriacus TaxID=106335 RepID=A0A6A3AVG3_HIBSY|nr:Isoaspartyl peptidase/L-asparaginase [Hibiscus syriacus]